MRRTAATFLSLLSLVATAGPAALGQAPSPAPDELTVLKTGPGELPPGKRLYGFLESQAAGHFQARRKAIAALKTPDDVAKRQAELRVKIRQALGELPAEKTPLHGRTIAREVKDGYTVERVVYESRPKHHVTANFYIPDGPGPFPGVLVPCGHSVNGKAAETYQRACMLMAKNGLAVLCYDPIGQGERYQLLDAKGKPAIPGSTTEHTMVGVGAWLVGRTAAGYRVWDGLRSLDYLASRSEVDPNRLGCTGNSGGGTLTAYLMALDHRIAVAAPSCYITSLERLFATIGPQDAEQNLTGQVALGIEHADYVTLRAPKPTLLSVGTQDFFDIDGSWVTFREVKKIYGILGYGERVDLFESDEPHGFTKPRRQAVTRWLRRWLAGKDEPTTEAAGPIADDKDLQVTSTGQVLSEYKGVSAFDLTAEKARELAKARPTGRDLATLRGEVRKALALPGTMELPGLSRDESPLERDGYTIKRLALTPEPGVTIPLLQFLPQRRDAEKSVVVYIGADRALAAPGGPIETRVKSGQEVVILEPRGTGETRPTPPGRGGYGHGPFGGDEREAFLALHIARPLLGQRVVDVLQALRALKPDGGRGRFHLVGQGAGGPVALHAAALSEDVVGLDLEGSILSWTAIATTPITRGQLSSVVPGVLSSYDLPDLAEAVAPLPLTLKAAVDPTGLTIEAAEVANAYARVKTAYLERGATGSFKIEP